MKLIKKMICISLVLCLSTSFMHAFSFTNGIVRPIGMEIQQNIKNNYGVNIIMPQNSSSIDIEESMAVIEYSISRFPNGVIKEITDYYLSNGIKTNIIIQNTENNLLNKSAVYKMTNQSANITVNILSNNFYGISDIVSLDGLTLEFSRLVTDYLYAKYGYNELKNQFEKLNNGYDYGTWGNGYDRVFVNQNSATNINEDISELIWYAENYPEKIRNVDNGKKATIHKKIEFLAKVFNESFESVNDDTKLWFDAIPGRPDYWAVDVINNMTKVGLIPKEFEGKYESYISREDFCTLALNIVKSRIGEDKFYEHYNIVKPQVSLNINPVNGEVIVDNIISDVFYDINLCKNKEDIYEAYTIGLISGLYEGKFEPQTHITRLEAAKVSTSICEQFGIDITDYDEINFDDISELSALEKPYIYFVVNRGILKGYGNKVMPYNYCTYQEAYIMLNRVYVLNN